MSATLAISSSSVGFVEPRPNAAGAQSRKVATMMGWRVCAKRYEPMGKLKAKRVEETIQRCASAGWMDSLTLQKQWNAN